MLVDNRLSVLLVLYRLHDNVYDWRRPALEHRLADCVKLLYGFRYRFRYRNFPKKLYLAGVFLLVFTFGFVWSPIAYGYMRANSNKYVLDGFSNEIFSNLEMAENSFLINFEIFDKIFDLSFEKWFLCYQNCAFLVICPFSITHGCGWGSFLVEEPYASIKSYSQLGLSVGMLICYGASWSYLKFKKGMKAKLK